MKIMCIRAIVFLQSRLKLFVFSLAIISSTAIAYGETQNRIAGTHYTGSTWAPAAWSNLNINRVPHDLREIQSNGFNTIILIVPWVGFQTEIDPPRYAENYFELLSEILSEARGANLKVILRIGYAHEIGQASTPDHHTRILNLFTNNQLLQAWHEYLSRLNKLCAKFDNFLFGFISWEDFFLIDYAHSGKESRIKLSQQLGYNQYIQKFSLKKLSEWYQIEFRNYSDVPIPEYHSPAISIFHEFWDQYLIRLFKESKSVFPNLSMEVRVDCDPDYKKNTYICHEDTFNVGDSGDKTIIYFTPAWGAANNGNEDSAKTVIKRFEYLIDKIRAETDKEIFIDQLNFIDNTPGFHNNTVISKNELSEFIDKSFEIINKSTTGYALWTMKDVRGNCIGNGSFEHGGMGWEIENGEIVFDEKQKEKRVLIYPNGYLNKKIHLGKYVNPRVKSSGLSFTLEFETCISTKNQGRLKIELVDESSNNSIFNKEISFLNTDIDEVLIKDIPLFVNGVLRIRNIEGDILVDNFELYFRAQENGIYDVDGNPKPFRDAIVKLNNSLNSDRRYKTYYDREQISEKCFDGLYKDGWAGKVVSGVLEFPEEKGAQKFMIKAYVPENWKGYKNKIEVFLSGEKIGSFELKPGLNAGVVNVKNDKFKSERAPFKIVSDKTFSPKVFNYSSADIRELCFILVAVGYAD